ncbi:MAG TPA: hypothetical protein G4O00_08025 [Thermoflexia bacterium]|jgi:dextranase|nr:hypothetical protein [Thermoflexia bacterium]
MRVEVYPHKACYRPGEIARLTVDLHGPAGADVQVLTSFAFLCDEVARKTRAVRLNEVGKATLELAWCPPTDAPRGYGVDVQVTDMAGRVLATGSTAFDVLERWTQAPRYGFLCDFRPGRSDLESAAGWWVRYHLNGLQFYDWMYRHERLLPPAEVFTDPLGRRLSLTTVRRLIETAHAHGVAAMAYAAVYGASVPFYHQHPDWALLDADGRPIPFGEDFLMIMDPSPGSPWTDHLLSEFDRMLRELGFDGVHLDQYGDPKEGYDARGRPVALDRAFPSLIRATSHLVHRHRGPEGATAFNAVGNWPIEAVAGAETDFVYIEVWPPDVEYRDLHRLVVDGQRLGGGKPVVLAVYIDPAHERNVRLADGVIFASGGFRIELGEVGGLLSDPYFPKHGRMTDGLADTLRRYYDFLVRYENVLSLGTRDATLERGRHVVVEGAGGQEVDVWAVVRQGEGFETISLINLPKGGRVRWDQPLGEGPPVLTDLRVRYPAERPIERVWWASPDGPLRAAPLPFAGQDEVTFSIPQLGDWALVVLEWA